MLHIHLHGQLKHLMKAIEIKCFKALFVFTQSYQRIGESLRFDIIGIRCNQTAAI